MIFVEVSIEYISFFFFFQAEDGIRDLTVTGVQTCALPICKKNAYQCAETKTHQKVRHLGTYAVRHNNLQSQPSTARVKLQSFLTGISHARRDRKSVV